MNVVIPPWPVREVEMPPPTDSAFPQLAPRYQFRSHDPLDSVPSITRQTKWDCRLLTFANRRDVQYFNPAIVDWHGRRLLITRRRRLVFKPGRNDITVWTFNEALQPNRETVIQFPRLYANEHWEDPRAIVMADGKLLVTYSTFLTYRSFVQQGCAWITPQFRAIPFFTVYGKNRARLRFQAAHEKNWLWFEREPGRLSFVYESSPRHVVVDSATREESISTGLNWSYGHIRGGSAPIRFDGLWWSFFHSSIDLPVKKAPYRRYYMGAYAFSAEPPYKPAFMTYRPLLVGSEFDPKESHAPYCVFPCGAVLDGAGTTNPVWTVSLGVNDCNCALIKIPHADLMMEMLPT